jgi:hypothetical protein
MCVAIYSYVLALVAVWFVTFAVASSNGRVRHRQLQSNSTVPYVSGLRLIDVISGQPVSGYNPIKNKTVINLATLSSSNRNWTLEAIMKNDDGTVKITKSVQFSYDNITNFRTETSPPYTMCGDSASAYRMCSELTTLGVKQIVATAFVENTNSIPKPYRLQLRVMNKVVTPTAPSPVSAPVSSPVTRGAWIEVNPNATSIIPRHEACFVMVGRKAYLLAGRYRGNNAVDIYDPVQRTWSKGRAPPIELHHTQCVAVDGKMWIVSSWTGNYPGEDNTEFIYVRGHQRSIRFGGDWLPTEAILTSFFISFFIFVAWA